MRFLSSLRDDDARGWLFAIVRNTWYSRVARRANMAEATPLDCERDARPDIALDPEERVLQQHTVAVGSPAATQPSRRSRWPDAGCWPNSETQWRRPGVLACPP